MNKSDNKFSKKLTLNKETVALLNDDQMNTVKGGYDPSYSQSLCGHSHLYTIC